MDQLSEKEKREKYYKNRIMVEEFESELKQKKDKYNNNKELYERFLPNIIKELETNITQIETENERLLKLMVLFPFKSQNH